MPIILENRPGGHRLREGAPRSEGTTSESRKGTVTSKGLGETLELVTGPS